MKNISRRVFGTFLGSTLTVFMGSKAFATTKPKPKKKVVKPVKQPTGTPNPVLLNGQPVAVTDVPLGGSLSATYADPVNQGVQNILLHRTTATTVVAFSAICTHRGCIVLVINPTSFDCPCHGSSYDSQTGQVLNGPAPRALTQLSVATQKGVLVILPR
jgi:Rieske Fe-S protein